MWRRKFGRFRDGEEGSVMVFFAIAMAIVLGFSALIYDVGRLLGSATDFQSFVDHAAITAAGELDGNPGARARAQTAITQLIQDREYFSDSGLGTAGGEVLDINDVSLRFLADIPADDTQPIGAGLVATDDLSAAFVEVTLNPKSISFQFIRVAAAITGNATLNQISLQTQAVAGFTEYVCAITPLMFCAPPGMSQAALRNYLPGRMLNLKNQSFWGPGAFGLLDVNFDPNGPCGNPNEGASYFACAVAVESSITRCFQRDGVDVRPGQAIGPSMSAFNVRYDIYKTTLSGEKNDPNFRPAPNVVSGYRDASGSGCYGGNDPDVDELSTNSMAMPNDDCFALGTCPHSNRFGEDTDWTTEVTDGRLDYINMNHDGVVPAGAGSTRYSMYLAELAAAGGGSILTGKEETGRHTCAPSQSPEPERRVFIAAAVDCTTLPPGNASGVPVLDFYRLFMTRMAGRPDPADLWLEAIDVVDPFGAGAGAGTIRGHIQLYR